MPVVVKEKPDSRALQTGPNASLELRYDIHGTDSEATAQASLEATAPLTWGNLRRRYCSVEPVAITGDGQGIWSGTARYERKDKADDPPATGARVITFDTSGGTQHITQSIATVMSYAPEGKNAPDCQGAIGVTQDVVEGCDIIVPTFKFTVTAYIAAASVTPTYLGKIYALTGKVNNAPFTITGFGTFSTGELLFLGASGSKRGDGSDWEIQFNFAASPNKTNIVIGDIDDIEKEGWQYLWVRYEDAVDPNAGVLIKRPAAVYVEKVYPDGDFGELIAS